MFALLLFVVLFFAICEEASVGNTWAVLVAGSKGFENFRHQADVCQAYQQLLSQGIPEERIIVFMYDDIAHNLENPHKGSIINYPGGPNVYPGVPHDYTKLHVTPHNFLKVLKGEKMDVGSKKTLQSNENDNVFVYFTDHGAPGILAFPIQMFETLHAKELNEAIEYMSSHKMFKKLVFYVEACESGSMFNGILKTPNVYAVTASNPFESSWACDYDSKYDSYLNDCWSGDWMADSRDAISKHTMTTRTLLEQFDSVHNVSTKSPECKYGDTSFQSDTLIEFQGQPSSSIPVPLPIQTSRPKKTNARRSKVSSRLVKYEYLLRRASLGKDWEDELKAYESYMKFADAFWLDFKDFFGVSQMWGEQYTNKYDPADHCFKEDSVIDMDCNKDIITLVEDICGHFDEYSLQYVGYISQGCIENVLDVEKTKEYLTQKCN